MLVWGLFIQVQGQAFGTPLDPDPWLLLPCIVACRASDHDERAMAWRGLGYFCLGGGGGYVTLALIRGLGA